MCILFAISYIIHEREIKHVKLVRTVVLGNARELRTPAHDMFRNEQCDSNKHGPHSEIREPASSNSPTIPTWIACQAPSNRASSSLPYNSNN